MNATDFKALVQSRFKKDDLRKIIDALEFAELAHAGQPRKSGEPYVTHVIGTAAKLIALGMDADTVIAGLLHDVPEDTSYTLNDIEKLFGPTVQKLVAGVSKLGQLKYRGLERYVENLRRMFVAVSKDVRVMIIKFADRLNNLETLDALPRDKQVRIARESMEIFAPLAHRLGMGEIKGQLEDLSFPYVMPKEYAWVRTTVGPRYEALDRIIGQMTVELITAMRAAKITPVDVHGRRKHLYSLYQKLIRPEYNRDLKAIHDLVALRLVMRDVADCYAALGVVHNLWRPVPNRFKDYIAQPKPNGYQSIHTAVFGPANQPVEIQIRDAVMHQLAEYGVAAHWHYAETGKPLAVGPIEDRLAWVKDLAGWNTADVSDAAYLDRLKIDVLQKRIFCFTPAGDVIDLPEHATPVDFAYHIHSDLGRHCVGARINDRLVALDAQLRSGDVVEIITDKNRRRPNPDWLEFVTTQNARGHIRRALRDSPTME